MQCALFEMALQARDVPKLALPPLLTAKTVTEQTKMMFGISPDVAGCKFYISLCLLTSVCEQLSFGERMHNSSQADLKFRWDRIRI